MTTMIEVEHLKKTYGTTTGITDVSFSVARGEILGFLGPNGAGKTTTMRILTGYLPADQGEARIDGLEVHEDPMGVRQRIGYLPETPPLYPDMTVADFLLFVAQIKGVSRSEQQQKVAVALERCGLGAKRQVLIRKLSKGFRQRVGIAQAIVHEPPVMILDEPTVGLDPRQIIEVRELIRGLAGDHTIILCSHILPEVSMTCDRVAIIHQGQVVATNTPAGLLSQLEGGVQFNLEVAGDPGLVRQVLTGLEGVQTTTLDHLPSGLITVHLHATAATVGPHAVAALVQAGIAIHEVSRTQATLEDVFLRLTTTEGSPTP